MSVPGHGGQVDAPPIQVPLVHRYWITQQSP